MIRVMIFLLLPFTAWGAVWADETPNFPTPDPAEMELCVQNAAGSTRLSEAATAFPTCYRQIEHRCHEFYRSHGALAIGHFHSHICIEAEINVWTTLLEKAVQDIQNILETELHPVSPQTFAAAQARWNDYVDEDCKVIRQAHGSGSGESYIMADCYGMHTAQRYIRLVTTPF